MTVATNHLEATCYYVIHPLDDETEQKCSAEGLSQIHMSPSVRLSLITLRGYLIVVVGLAIYRLLELMGLFGHHLAR
jgi:hypothetical protein